MAVSLTGELWLKVGQAHMVRPVFRADHARMRALTFLIGICGGFTPFCTF